MKYLASIFGIYFLFLSLLPCNDMGDCKSMDAGAHTEYATSDHSDHQSDSETCPPLCVCVCCGQSVVSVFSASEFTRNLTPSEKVYPALASDFYPEVFFKIWQPPKIS